MLEGKGMRALFLVSLMLNAFLLGSILTHFARGHRGPPGRHGIDHEQGARPVEERGPKSPGGEPWGARGPVEARLLRDVVRALGGPRDPRVRTALQEGKPRMFAHRERMERARTVVRDAMAAQPYDEIRMKTSLAELRRATEVGQEEAQTTLLQLASQLTGSERAALGASESGNATGRGFSP